MLKENYIQKKDVRYCLESFSLQDALNVINDSGFRAVPVLNQDETKYLGIVSKVSIYEYTHNNPAALSESILKVVTDASCYIQEEAPFYKLLFTIRRLPFIAVVDHNEEFLGIVTHAKVMDFLEDSLGLKTNGYIMTVVTNEFQGALTNLVSLVKDHCTIESLVTLDSGDKYLRRIMMTLPRELTDELLEQVMRELETKGFRVTHCEKIGA